MSCITYFKATLKFFLRSRGKKIHHVPVGWFILHNMKGSSNIFSIIRIPWMLKTMFKIHSNAMYSCLDRWYSWACFSRWPWPRLDNSFHSLSLLCNEFPQARNWNCRDIWGKMWSMNYIIHWIHQRVEIFIRKKLTSSVFPLFLSKLTNSQ